MAVDTRDKRMSMVTLGSPVPAVLPNPDGTVETQDRAMFIWLYHGLSLSAVVAIVDLTARARDFSLTAQARDFSLTARTRDFSLTVKDR